MLSERAPPQSCSDHPLWFFSLPFSKSDFKSLFNIASLGSTHQIKIRFYPIWGMALSTLWSLLNMTAAPFNNQVLKQNSHYFTVPSIEKCLFAASNTNAKLGETYALRFSDPQILDRLSSKMLTYCPFRQCQNYISSFTTLAPPINVPLAEVVKYKHLKWAICMEWISSTNPIYCYSVFVYFVHESSTI